MPREEAILSQNHTGWPVAHARSSAVAAAGASASFVCASWQAGTSSSRMRWRTALASPAALGLWERTSSTPWLTATAAGVFMNRSSKAESARASFTLGSRCPLRERCEEMAASSVPLVWTQPSASLEASARSSGESFSSTGEVRMRSRRRAERLLCSETSESAAARARESFVFLPVTRDAPR